MGRTGQGKIKKKSKNDIRKKVFKYIKNILGRPLSKLILVMIMILVVIAVLLIQGIDINNANSELKNVGDNVFVECKDNRLNNFIKGYFRARTYLDFQNIYRAFDKDYLLLKDTEVGKKYDNGILYEKNYVSGYNNIKVYEHDGLVEDEKVVLITYDIGFYFSDVLVPSMIVGYVKDDDKKIYFKENLDIGESKYISNLMELTMVKNIYVDIKNRLELLLTNDNKLKLAYNSIRQYDMNPNSNMLDDKDTIIEKIFGEDSSKEKELINLALEKEKANEKK